MNRKGGAGDFVNFIGFFLIMIIIGGGIIGGYLVFFGQGYDFRQAEADTLFVVVRDCFLDYPEDLFRDDFNKNDFLEHCRLNENVAEDRLIYVREVKDGGREFFIGVYDYQTQCFLVDDRGAFAKCRKQEVLKNGDKFELIVGSDQQSRRVAL